MYIVVNYSSIINVFDGDYKFNFTSMIYTSPRSIHCTSESLSFIDIMDVETKEIKRINSEEYLKLLKNDEILYSKYFKYDDRYDTFRLDERDWLLTENLDYLSKRYIKVTNQYLKVSDVNYDGTYLQYAGIHWCPTASVILANLQEHNKGIQINGDIITLYGIDVEIKYRVNPAVLSKIMLMG